MSTAAHPIDLVSYEDLYQRWEQGNWSAMAIDFSQDREGWRQLTDVQRRSALWIYSMFFYGEDAVTDTLSPYIDAAPREEQKYFLASQQVDEARHSVFFARFFREVIGAGDSIASGLAYTEPELNWSYRRTFEHLDRTAEELRRDRSLPMFARAICMYHMIIEAALAQPGQHYIEDYFTRTGTMPGFREGMANVSRDEQRHIGFGVKVLSELFAESEECKQAVIELLREVLRYTIGVFIPPGWDREYTRCYGFELEDVYAFGFQSLETKFKTAGLPFSELPSEVMPLDLSTSPAERAARQLALVEAGVIGPPHPDPDGSPQTQRMVFDILERSVRTEAANGQPFTIQWRFADVQPWHLTIDNGSTQAEPGLTADPDVTLSATWGDWVRHSLGHEDPKRGLLTGKLKVSGPLRSLVRLPRVFPPR